MHVSDRKGRVSIEVQEGELIFDGGVSCDEGKTELMLEFYSMNYEIARKLRDGLNRLLDSRDVILSKGLEIMTRTQ